MDSATLTSSPRGLFEALGYTAWEGEGRRGRRLWFGERGLQEFSLSETPQGGYFLVFTEEDLWGTPKKGKEFFFPTYKALENFLQGKEKRVSPSGA